MDYFSNPIVWLCRFRHRRGYGVHSPFAFDFLSEVVYEQTPYVLYSDLDPNLGLLQRFRVRKVLHLLFRCANWYQPHNIVVRGKGISPFVCEYLHAGCLRANMCRDYPEGVTDFCFLDGPDEEFLVHCGENTMLVLDNLRTYREWFYSLPSVVTMDLYDIGIAFFDHCYKKQDYIVCF